MGCFLYNLRAPVRARSSALGEDVRRSLEQLTILNSRIYGVNRRAVSRHVLRDMWYSSSGADSHIMRGINGIAVSEGEAANSGLMLIRLWSRQLEGHQLRRVPRRGVQACGRHCPEAATEKSSSRNFTGQKSEHNSYPYHAAASAIRLIERCFAALFPQLYLSRGYCATLIRRGSA